MKKLLIAMSAAAMFSLCAKADTTPTLLGSMDFETGYSAGAPIATGSVDPSNLDPNPNQLVFWAGDNGESQIAVEGENKYLKVDTTAVLTRKTAALDEDTNPVDPVEIGTGDITVSSKVQFTAADEAPVPDEGDKLIVWAKAPDEDDPNSTTTNLMVTAKTANGVVTNFVTDVLVDAETWYDLEIKAVATGSKGEGDASVAFTVSIAPSGSTLEAVTVDDQPATFKSLLATSDPAAQTIASIGFKGTGAVDDIVFAKNAAEEPVTVTLNVEEGIDLLTSALEPFEGTVTGVPGTTYQLYVVGAASGFAVTGATIADGTGDMSGIAIITITIAKNLTVSIATAGSGPVKEPVEFTVTPSDAVVDGLAAAYYVGDSIDPNNLIPTPSSPYKRATVTVKVNGDVITTAYELKKNDVLSVEVTEEDITFALTLPEVTGASASVTTGGVQVVDLTTILTGTVVTVTWTPAADYKITAGATEEITMSENKTATAPTVSAITYATLTITPVANCTIVVKNGEDTVETGAKFDVDDAVQLTVTRTPAQGYQLDNCAAEETITMSEDRTVTAAVVQSSGDFVPTYIAGKSQETIAKYKAWASNWGDDTQSANEDAYLLNCEPTAEAVAAAKAAFKFTSITPGVIPTIDGSGYNGVVVILGGTSLSEIASWDKATTTDTFFKATLVVEETND